MINDMVCIALEAIFGIWIVCTFISMLFHVDAIGAIVNAINKLMVKKGKK